MKITLLVIITAILIMTGCSANHIQLAEKYNLDLQYYQNSVKFSKKGMVNESFLSCNKTSILRNECFTSLAQDLIIYEHPINIEWCDEIKPGEKMNMTMKSFRYVYNEIDDILEKELNEKLNPSEQRRQTRANVKELCYIKAK